MNHLFSAFAILFAGLFLSGLTLLPAAAPAPPPNILIILADDLGYGDVGCYNDRAKAPTPNIDRLAREGMRFTDAHSPATVCTPTRYSLMTGQMAFRVPRGGSVFTGSGGKSGPDLLLASRGSRRLRSRCCSSRPRRSGHRADASK